MKLIEKIEETRTLLLNASRTPVSSFETEAVECGYKKGHTPPESGWQSLPFLQGDHKHYWLRGRFQTPPADERCFYLLSVNTGLKGWDGTNPQGLLYLNGKMVQGLDTNHTEAFLEPDTDYEMRNYFYTGIAEQPIFVQNQVIKVDRQIEALYYDIETPLEALAFLNENSREYRQILSALEQACNILDLRHIGNGDFYQSVDAARAFLEAEFYQKLCSPEGKPVVHCIGHTHIDVEWKWARNQTREKIQRSFATAKALMDKYPEYRFTLSQPELYRYLKEDAPEKYDELKELIANGRWEPEGAMWLEADCNLTGGESFVRQILQGKEFFRREFGKENCVLFLPDVFGYSAALPQILLKSGIDYFVTSKISWNDTNTLPYDTFYWQGIDGSEIFTTFITAQKTAPGLVAQNRTTYVGKIDASYVMGAWNRYQQKEYSENTLLTYGFGDGGGGPTREMLEKQRRLQRGIPGLPVTKLNFLVPYLEETVTEFNKNCQKLRRTPKWVGELYLEFHRGTYTAMAANKRGNRKSEQLLQKSEALSYADLFHGGSYDQESLNRIWRKVLHNQFHDILPGSSIEEVYKGTAIDYAQIAEGCNQIIADKLKSLAAGIGSQGGWLVYNALGHQQWGPVQINGKTVELKEPVPAFGWQVMESIEPENHVTVGERTAENRYYRLQLDEAGRIASLFDKEANREVFLPDQPGNELRIFEDYPHVYDAWELEDTYKAKKYVLDTPAVVRPITDGSRSGFSIEREYLNSRIYQNLWLYSENRRIDFETKIDWHEKHHLLKAAFPLNVHTDRAAYEIQFGHVYRPTHENSSWDQARFEVCGHKWADLSEHGYGVSLLNDCKYGHNAEGSTLSLTLLKCPAWPNPHADEGEHLFTYSLLPHKGDLYEAGVIREAYDLNQPLEATVISGREGPLPATFSLVSCNAENVVVETVKKAEKSDAMVVRLYEAFNSRGSVTLTVPSQFQRAALCDLEENELEEWLLINGTVTFPIKNFELITVKFSK